MRAVEADPPVAWRGALAGVGDAAVYLGVDIAILLAEPWMPAWNAYVAAQGASSQGPLDAAPQAVPMKDPRPVAFGEPRLSSHR